MRYPLVFLIFIFSIEAEAQQAQSWFSINAPLRKGDWEWHNDAGYRNELNKFTTQQFLFRTGIRHYFTDKISGAFGYAFFDTKVQGVEATEFGPENRLWQEFNGVIQLGKRNSFIHRIRTEERWFSQTSIGESFFGFRSRYRFAFQRKLNENIDVSTILVTGNTVIDALFESIERVSPNPSLFIQSFSKVLAEKEVILVTGHRRENHGDGFVRICEALKVIAQNSRDLIIVYPVHLNPKVQEPVLRVLSGVENILLIDPLAYPDFIFLVVSSKTGVFNGCAIVPINFFAASIGSCVSASRVMIYWIFFNSSQSILLA
jgi:hypothetical protein